jgi:hypothetical protein
MRTLLVVSVGAALTGLVINQVIAWDPVWTAWVADNFTDPTYVEVLGWLPGLVVLAQILAVIATALPRAISF